MAVRNGGGGSEGPGKAGVAPTASLNGMRQNIYTQTHTHHEQYHTSSACSKIQCGLSWPHNAPRQLAHVHLAEEGNTYAAEDERLLARTHTHTCVAEDDVQNVFITTRMWQKMNVLPYHAPQLLPYHAPRHLAHVHSAE